MNNAAADDHKRLRLPQKNAAYVSMIDLLTCQVNNPISIIDFSNSSTQKRKIYLFAVSNKVEQEFHLNSTLE